MIFKSWIEGVAAGICIAIGTTTYLLIENKLLGAFIFSLGLFLVCVYQLKLCTGMAGYLLDKTRTYKYSNFVLATIGNICGVFLVWYLVITWNSKLSILAEQIMNTKLSMTVPQILVSGLFCGMLMFFAVDIFKHSKYSLLGIFLCVPCFIINGFDHCVVTVFYVLSSITTKSIMFFLLVMLSNFSGSIIAWFLFYYARLKLMTK